MTAKPNLESIPRSAAPAAPAAREPTARPTLVASSRPLPDDHIERNPGTPLDLDVVRGIRVNRSAVERRAATIPTRRTVKKEWQAAWLLRAITLIDLTTLSGDDTPGNVRRLRESSASDTLTISLNDLASPISGSPSARCASITRS
jgi:hypothetical protein